jgi:hypothetical protein
MIEFLIIKQSMFVTEIADKNNSIAFNTFMGFD